jgi:hypothetical protein
MLPEAAPESETQAFAKNAPASNCYCFFWTEEGCCNATGCAVNHIAAATGKKI